MKATANLNDRVIPSDHDFGEPWQLNDFRVESGRAYVQTMFRDLTDAAVAFIGEADYVVACVAWLTSRTILRALSWPRGVAIMVQKEDFLRPDRAGSPSNRELRALYEKIPVTIERGMFPPPLRSASIHRDPRIGVRCVGERGQGQKTPTPRCHHKFMVSCTLTGGQLSAQAVWTGSFNFTHNAERSLENAVIIRDERVADAYLREFAQVAMLSEPLDWEHPWIDPEWRIGT